VGPEALPRDVVVMSWRGEKGGIEAAEGGLDVVMSPNTYLYFDYYQAEGEGEPLAIGSLIPLSKVYEYQVVPSGLSAEAAAHILGSQCNVWTEYMPTPEHVEYMWAPRALAFAEAVWRDPAAAVEPFETFVAERLRPHLARLDAIGVNYRKLD
jgi:hexosaminidase